MCIRICPLVSRVPTSVTSYLSVPGWQWQKDSPTAHVRFCLTNGVCHVAAARPGESCQVLTERPRATKGKQEPPCVVCGGTSHARKVIPQNKGNSLKGNTSYFNKSSSGNWCLLMKSQKRPAGQSRLFQPLRVPGPRPHGDARWVPSDPHKGNPGPLMSITLLNEWAMLLQ